MYRRADDMMSETKVGLRGGAGQVQMTHLFQSGEFKGKSRLCAKITLEPGSSIGYHEHVDEDEIYYILKGQAVFVDSTAGAEVLLNPGDASVTLSGQSHAIRNDSADTVEILAVILLYH